MRISDWSSDVCSSDLVDFLSVKLFGEIEEMRFEQFLRRIEARTDAEIGGALQDAAVWEAAGNRVDAVARSQILTHFQIGGREAQEAAVLIPMLHSPAHGEGAGEQARRG